VLLQAVARGLAAFFAGFTLLNLVGAWRSPGFDENIWWIDLRYLPAALAAVILAAVAVLLLAYAVRPAVGGRRRAATLAVTGALAAAALENVVAFYVVWRRGEIDPHVPLPLSLLIAAALGIVVWATATGSPASSARRAAWRRGRRGGRVSLIVAAGTLAACVVLFPLAQVFFFGTTDYRRQADVAVVFGAQVHDDGSPSTALVDRVTTGADLYKHGTVPILIMSGAVGASGYDEAQVMRQMAVEQGVPARDIIVDSHGVNTNATVADTLAIFRSRDFRRVLAVSHFYHLPRVKLAYERAGVEVYTVPAESTGPIAETPRLVLREIPAFWVYYLRAIAR
jgi:vancomycin permeability regulator SanA